MSMPNLEMQSSSGSSAPSATYVPRMSRPIRTTSGGFPAATDVRNVAGSKSFSVNSSATSGYCSAKISTRVVPISSAPPSPGVHGIGLQPYFAPTVSVPLMSAAPAEAPPDGAPDAPGSAGTGLAPVLSPLLHAPTARTRANPRAAEVRFVSIDPPPGAAIAGAVESQAPRSAAPGVTSRPSRSVPGGQAVTIDGGPYRWRWTA